MKIIFTGDLFTGGQLVESDQYKDYKIGINSFSLAYLRICNLEQATSDSEYFEQKSTVHAPLKSLQFLINNNINIVTLSNNHIHDKGEKGLNDCISELDSLGIKYTGAGRNIEEASRPVKLAENLYLLAYCDYNNTYLKKIKIATEVDYGVNKLSYDNILNDLKKIPETARAILHFHWGRENVWFPPLESIEIAKKLLEIDKVHSIIGMHSHRFQGRIKHNNKYAFFSLGNFLFPNFFIEPRTQMVYPKNPINYKTTKEYHPVFSLTKKKWKYFNRVSIIVSLEDDKFNLSFVKQNSKKPYVMDLTGFEEKIHRTWLSIMSYIYTKKMILSIFAFVFNNADKVLKYSRILMFYIVKERKIFSIFFLKRVS